MIIESENVRTDTRAEIGGAVERGSGTETEALQGAMREEMMMIALQEGTEICSMTEEVVEVDDVVIEATVMLVSEVDLVEIERRVHLPHPRRRNPLPT